ncbi:nicotinamidase-like [Convolutriloba macropyga]|uniref:nicotinamidase-like n=1 Tax=Convolutriloba macropyga TaxID=536237 RepID=UPI003F526C81
MLAEDMNELFGIYSTDKKLPRKNLISLLQSIFDSASEIECESLCDSLLNRKDVDLSMPQFKIIWDNFLEPVLKPVSAFVIVDVQNDFISGSLALTNCPAQEDGAEVVPVINRLLTSTPFSHVFYTYDWHPRNHISFHSNLKLHKSRLLSPQPDNWESVSMFDRVQFDGKPPLEQTMWPDHCIQGTDGAKLHKELKFIEGGLEIYKGFNHSVDSYSAFWDNGEVSATGLLNELNSRNVTDVYVCGLATDICVNFTATHACKHNFRVILVEDACRGVDTAAIAQTKEKLSDLGALIRTSDTILPLVKGEEIPIKLAMVAADNFRRKFAATLLST